MDAFPSQFAIFGREPDIELHPVMEPDFLASGKVDDVLDAILVDELAGLRSPYVGSLSHLR